MLVWPSVSLRTNLTQPVLLCKTVDEFYHQYEKGLFNVSSFRNITNLKTMKCVNVKLLFS